MTPSRVFRGGDFASGMNFLRVAYRHDADPSSHGYGVIGLRCARKAE